MEKIQDLIGREVRIYPGDTYTKRGIIMDMNENGVLFKITQASRDDRSYTVGALHFISYSARLSFEFV